MGSERGSAALAVIGAVVLATLVGVGVYVVIKDRRLAEAEVEARVAAAPPPAVAPATPSPPAPTPEPEPPVPVAPERPVDIADANAVDPEVGTDPPATNAPVFGTPGIDGQLDAQGVATAVRATSSRLQRCFETRLETKPRIGGTLRVRLVINRRGGVTTATATGFDDELGTCVTSVFRDVRLPKTSDGGIGTVVVPISFQRVDWDDGDVRGPPITPCDEVSCVLNNYEGACCAKYKRGAPPSSDPPESVSRQELTEALQALRIPVAACATREAFAGIIKVRFRILPSGKVDDVRIEDVEPALATCITRAFKARTFTATTNGVTAAFPFKITGD